MSHNQSEINQNLNVFYYVYLFVYSGEQLNQLPKTAKRDTCLAALNTVSLH